MANDKDFKVKNGIKPTVYHEAVGTVVSGSVAYSLASSSYDGVSFSVTAQETLPVALTFKPDGASFFVYGATNNTVYQYSLSTAWDLSTATYASKSMLTTQDGDMYGMAFNSDGSSIYIVGTQTDSVHQYTLSTPWDISTGTYASKSFSVASQETYPLGLSFKSDGTKMYVVGQASDTIYQYSLSTAWDISTASYDSVSFSIASQAPNPTGLYISSDGVNVFVSQASNNSIYKYTMGTPWDISTATFSESFSDPIYGNSMFGVALKPDGTKMYINGLSTDTIYQYSTTQSTASLDLSTGSVFELTPTSDLQVTLSNPAASGTVSGATLLLDGAATPVYDTDAITYENKSFSLATQDTAPNGVWFKPDGTKMYSVGFTNDRVYQYSLSTAWDISTASYDSVFYSVASQDSVPKDVQFKPDGLTMFVYGAASETMYQYTLSTAWDVSTASYASKSFVFAQGSSRNGAWIGDSGTKMYMAEGGTDSLFQYTLSTAWDVSTASYASKTKSVAAQDTNPQKVALNSDGTKAFVLGQQNGRIYQYSLSTPWDISTASFVSSYTASQSSLPLDFFSDEAGRLYILYELNDTLYQYSMESICTITYDPIIQWAGGTAPDSPAVGEKDVLVFSTRDGGSTYSAALAIDGAA